MSRLREDGSLRLVKAVVDLVRGGASPEETMTRARRIRGSPEVCDSGYMCYYREPQSR